MKLIINIRRFEITDGDGNVALKILGPWCTYSCAGDVEFKVVETLVDVLPFLHSYSFTIILFSQTQVVTPDESHEVGRISKQWAGLLKEAFTDTDNFGIT